MSSLIVLCPHCLTWIETHAQCCTECAGDVNIEDDDPPVEELDNRLGDWLQDLGGAKLLRRGWPNIGRLIVSTEGLLFVPHFVVRPNGALDAITEGAIAGPARVKNLLHWWSLPVWRRPLDEPSASEVPPIPNQPLRNLLYDSPGAFFIERETIRRISNRWGRIQIERTSARMVSLAPIPGGTRLRESLRSLMEFASWRRIVAEL